MRFSRFFIDRPIFAIVISLVILAGGLLAVRSLAVSEYPEVTPPTITVTAVYPGANPTVLAQTVATPLEDAINGVEVTLTSKLTEVNGTVKDGSQPVKDYTIVVFADEPQKWTLPNSRYVTGSRPDQEGRFQIKNLPAGSYLAVAVDYLAQGEWNDPEVLERLKPKATSFSITEGDTKTLNLTLK